MRYLFVFLTLFPFSGWGQIQADDYIKLLAIDRELDFQQTGTSFSELIETFDLRLTEDNYRKFMEVQIVHRLLNQSEDAPDIWNFQEPNERHDITFQDGTPLTSLEHERYNSYADIDRTPYTYLNDLFSDEKYNHPKYGQFATFGWCAEREMSYAVAMYSLGYDVNVVAPGTHAWSRVSVNFINSKGNVAPLQAIVDNTFDKITWLPYDGVYEFNGLERWYNQQVKYSTNVLRKITVTNQRSREILQLFK